MPYTMKQLTKRYGQIVAKLDKSAPTAAERAEIERRIAALDVTLNTAEKALKKMPSDHWRELLTAAQTIADLASNATPSHWSTLRRAAAKSQSVADQEDVVSAFCDERHELKRRLGQRRVRLVSGKRGTAEGIVVGEGDTQAEALANAGQRVGKG